MKQILFRDEAFYVDVHIDSRFSHIYSYITVYTKRVRTGFWTFLGPKYIQVYRSPYCGQKEVQTREALIKALTVAWELLQDNVTECIQCSPEIEALYANDFSNKNETSNSGYE
jgi:hypothetical protein